MLERDGFAVFCDIDTLPRLTKGDGFSVMSRRHIDGLALTQQRRALAPFFDAGAVTDRADRRL